MRRREGNRMMEFYSSSEHKARKPHKCHLCMQEIVVGEKYQRESGKYDGDFFDRCSHMHCAKMIAEYLSERQEQEYDAEFIREWLSDTYCYSCESYSCENLDSCEGDILCCEKIIANFGGEING